MTGFVSMLVETEHRSEIRADELRAPSEILDGFEEQFGAAGAGAVLDATAAPLDAPGPPGYAQLIVQRRSATEFVVSGHRGAAPESRLPEIVSTSPQLGLGARVEKGGNQIPPEDLYDGLYYWSERLSAVLRNWLLELAESDDAGRTRLVIWDCTGFDIPWEALWLSPDDTDGTDGTDDLPLGARLAVTRWVASSDDAPDDFAPALARGPVVYYLDDEMAADQEALRPFTATALSAAGMAAAIADEAQPVGLVYFGCHGTWGRTFGELKLGAFRYRDFARKRLHAVRAGRPVVIINACHGGRVLADPIVGLGVFGFAEVFVRTGASAVVAPTGPIESELATRVAADVLRAVAGDSSTPVSVALRDVRARAAQEFRTSDGADTARTAALKRYIYTLMYVCFGNPFAAAELERGRP